MAATVADPIEGRQGRLTASELVTASTGSIADPGPLGLAGFAMTTCVLSVFNAHLITGKGLDASVLPLALFYGGIAQLLAGMWEFKKANTFGALAFTSFGAFWLSYAALAKYVLPGIPAASANQIPHIVGLFLLMWSIFTVYMTVASLRVTGAVAAVFVVLSLTFIALTIGAFGSYTSWTKIGGWLGLVTAALAWYASFAGVTNATYKRTVVPVFPLSVAK
jgi:succinate-acetate transporter protein